MFDKAKKFDQDVSGWTYHDGNTFCDHVLQDSDWVHTCYGGQSAETQEMFLDAEAFLSKYNCGVNGPPGTARQTRRARRFWPATSAT